MSAKSDSVAWQEDDEKPAGFYAPLRRGAFRLYWFASVAVLTALWMHDAGAAWFMRELSGADPFMVSLIQAAASLPVMILSLPMGTIGDIWDRRRLLLVANFWLLAVVVCILWATATGRMTPWLLVFMVSLVGVGKAMVLPGLASVIPEIVTRRELPLGVGLHSVANNMARIAGPAGAGVVAASLGIAAVFASNLVLIAASLLLLLLWRRTPRFASRSNGFLSELHSGLMYSVMDTQFRQLIARVLMFFLCAAALHALLPIIVHDPQMFGIAWSAFGVGAVAGAVVFPFIPERFPLDRQLNLGIFCHAVALGLLTVFESEFARLGTLALLGLFWFLVMASSQVAAQLVLPAHLRSRGMAAFVVVIVAGIGFGAPLWGLVAKLYSPSLSLLAAMSLSLLALAATYRIGRPVQDPD